MSRSNVTRNISGCPTDAVDDFGSDQLGMVGRLLQCSRLRTLLTVVGALLGLAVAGYTVDRVAVHARMNSMETKQAVTAEQIEKIDRNVQTLVERLIGNKP